MKKQKLNCENARNISIVKTLGNFGHFPKKESEKEAWFLSPFRSEIKASFKVSKRLNVWYDHGEGLGGNIIDLVIKLKKCSTAEALKILSQDINHFSFHQQTKIDFNREKKYKILKIKPLQHKALIDYLISRKIDREIARKYCKEVHYELNSKKYFAIAFKNDKNGFEIRNKYIKGNLVNKEISTIKNDSNKISVFEGFIDFLSFKTLYKNKSFQMDYVILNSVSNAKNIFSKIENYEKVFCFLDNDSAGKNATKLLLENHKNSTDFSFLYQGNNDFNEYLIKTQRRVTS